MPESDVVFNIFSSILWFWIVPGSIFIDLPVDLKRVVAGKTLPGAGSMSATLLQIFLLDSFTWEILVSLNDNTVITFGYGNTVPGCFRHNKAPSRNALV